MQQGNQPLVRTWQIAAVLCLFFVGTLALMALPYAGKPKQFPDLWEAAYYALGLFLGAGNPVGFPKTGPFWAVFLARVVYFSAPLLLAWTVLETLFRMTRSFFDRSEKMVDQFEDHVVVCGLGKLGHAIVDWNGAPPQLAPRSRTAAGGVLKQRQVVVLEKDPENPRIAQLREQGIPVLVGDQTQESFLRKAGLSRAHQLVAVSGDDIANLDAAHIAKRLNARLDVRCQVTNVQLQSLVQTASELEIYSFNSYDIAAQELIDQHIKEQVGELEAPVFVLAGIGRFGQMMLKNLIENYKDRELKIIIVDRRGEHIARTLRGMLPAAEGYLSPGHIYEGEIADPFLWRSIREEHALEHASVILCTDDDISNINTALMIGQQVGQDILVVSRMFREVSFMEKSQERFRVAVLSQLIQQGLLEILVKTK